VAAGRSCSVSVDVTVGYLAQTNNWVKLSFTCGGTPGSLNSNSAADTGVAPPGIGKRFGAASISLLGTTTLAFTIKRWRHTAGGLTAHSGQP
jgi:hypothetical protein